MTIDRAELVAHAREMREHLNDELPNGVGNTIDALCDLLESLGTEADGMLTTDEAIKLVDEAVDHATDDGDGRQPD